MRNLASSPDGGQTKREFIMVGPATRCEGDEHYLFIDTETTGLAENEGVFRVFLPRNGLVPGFPGTGIHSSDIMYEYCHVKDSTHNDDDVLGLRAYSMGSFKHSVNGCQWRTQWGSQLRSDKETLDTPSERCLASLSACRSACVCVCVCVCV